MGRYCELASNEPVARARQARYGRYAPDSCPSTRNWPPSSDDGLAAQSDECRRSSRPTLAPSLNLVGRPSWNAGLPGFASRQALAQLPRGEVDEGAGLHRQAPLAGVDQAGRNGRWFIADQHANEASVVQRVGHLVQPLRRRLRAPHPAHAVACLVRARGPTRRTVAGAGPWAPDGRSRQDSRSRPAAAFPDAHHRASRDSRCCCQCLAGTPVAGLEHRH